MRRCSIDALRLVFFYLSTGPCTALARDSMSKFIFPSGLWQPQAAGPVRLGLGVNLTCSAPCVRGPARPHARETLQL